MKPSTSIPPTIPQIGAVLTQKEIEKQFRCSVQGGMCRSLTTNTLVLISKRASNQRNIYVDEWNGDILLYTGEGQTGDQELRRQNKTLAESATNGVDLHLFEVFEDTKYTYRGRVKLAGPYETAMQPDKDGHDRLVYRFPLRLIEENDALSEEAFQQYTQKEQTRAKKLSKQPLTARASKISGEHAKSSTASHRFVKTVQYERSAEIARLTKERANGICELCGNPAPFLKKDDTPYLECHHIEWLSHGGKDTIENTVALCPNCHRKMHTLNLAEDVETLKRHKQTSSYDEKV